MGTGAAVRAPLFDRCSALFWPTRRSVLHFGHPTLAPSPFLLCLEASQKLNMHSGPILPLRVRYATTIISHPVDVLHMTAAFFFAEFGTGSDGKILPPTNRHS